MITLTGITKVYPGQNGPVHALNGIDLEVQAGEIFGIIGKSGAGKSTLIRCINMLERPTTGQVVVDGQDMTTLSEKQLRQARKRIGMIFQHFNLLSSRTVYGNVAFPLELAGLNKQAITERVRPLLELVGLSEHAGKYPAQLSGGQKQRVGIARALANKPRLLLCDEATSALDPQTTKAILQLLKDINRKFHLTIVLITHEMQVIKEICDRVAVIENGRIIEQGSIVDIFTRPQTTTTREFIKNVLNQDLPPLFDTSRLSPTPVDGGNVLVRLSFVGSSATEPVIAGMIRRCNVDASILYGNIDHIQDTLYGTLTLELAGDEAAIAAALKYLQAHELGLEVIGYVARDVRLVG